MNKYTIHTEAVNLASIKEQLNKYFEGYTLMIADGAYKGQADKALKIEVLNSENIDPLVKGFCQKIRDINNQECVLLVKELVQADFI